MSATIPPAFTQIQKIAAEFIARPRVPSKYPLTFPKGEFFQKKEGPEWSFSKGKMPIEELTTNFEVLHGLKFIMEYVAQVYFPDPKDPSARTSFNAAWLSGALESIEKLAQSRTAFEYMDSYELSCFQLELAFADEFLSLKNALNRLDQKDLVKACITHCDNSSFIPGVRHTINQAAVGNDVIGQYVHALSDLIDTLNQIKELGLTPEYLQGLMNKKQAEQKAGRRHS